MKKTISFILILSLIFCSAVAFADAQPSLSTPLNKSYQSRDIDWGEIIVEIFNEYGEKVALVGVGAGGAYVKKKLTAWAFANSSVIAGALPYALIPTVSFIGLVNAWDEASYIYIPTRSDGAILDLNGNVILPNSVDPLLS